MRDVCLTEPSRACPVVRTVRSTYIRTVRNTYVQYVVRMYVLYVVHAVPCTYVYRTMWLSVCSLFCRRQIRYCDGLEFAAVFTIVVVVVAVDSSVER